MSSQLRLIAGIAATTLRGWTMALGVPAAAVWPVIASGFAIAIATSWFGAFWLADSAALEPLDSPRVAILTLVALVWVTAFTGIFAAASATSSTGSIRFLRTLPLTDRALGAALAIPTLAVSLLQATLLAPVMGMVVARGLDVSLALGVFYALLANVIGTAQGRMLFGASRRVVMRRSRSRIPPQLLAIVGLALSVLAGQVVLATAWGMAPSTWVAVITAPLGWPGLINYVVNSDLAGVAALGVTLVLLVEVEVRGWPWLTAVNDARPRSASARLHWRAGPVIPLVAMQMIRMIRNERIRNLLGALLVLEVLTTALIAMADGEVRAGIIDNSIMLWCLTGSGLTIVARGISRRHRPHALILGFAPRRWGSSVALGGIALSVMCVVPPLLVVAWLQHSPMLLAGGLGQALFVGAVAALLGALATPDPGTSPAETLALAVVLGADLLVGNIVDRVTPLSSPAQISLVLGALGLPLLLAPGAIEARRWARDTAPYLP